MTDASNVKRSRFVYLMLTGLIAFSLSLSPRLSGQERPADLIQAVITEQLSAFKQGDYKRAYQFASKQIQSLFPLAAFEAMVRTGYPQIDKSLRVRFGDTVFSEDGCQAHVGVQITGMDRTILIARYEMILEDGAWKNNGVENLDVTTPI